MIRETQINRLIALSRSFDVRSVKRFSSLGPPLVTEYLHNNTGVETLGERRRGGGAGGQVINDDWGLKTLCRQDSKLAAILVEPLSLRSLRML
jgi:hypothetical protein